MAWISVKEFASLKGVSERAVRKGIAAGKYQVKEVPHPKRSDQSTYMVFAEPIAEPDCGTGLRNQNAEPECGTNEVFAEPIAEPDCGTRMRNQNAEPECGTNEVFAEPEYERTDQWGSGWELDELIRFRKVCNICIRDRRCANCCFTCKHPCARYRVCEIVKPWATDAAPYGFDDKQWQEAYDELKRTPATIKKIERLHDYSYKANSEAHNKAMGWTDDRPKAEERPAKASVTDEGLESSVFRNDGVAEDPLSLVVLNEKERFESYSRESREVAYARLEIVQMWIAEKQRAKASGIKIGELEKGFLRQVSEGRLCLNATQVLAKDGALKLSMRSIYRWEQSWRAEDSVYPVSLVDKWHVKRMDKDAQYARTWVKIQAVDPRGHQITDIIRMAQTAVPGFDLSYRTVARIVEAARKDKVLVAAMTGKTSWKNDARPHIRRVNDCAPGDRWESDGKTLNVLVMSPFWFHNDKSIRYLVRPVIVAWLDVATWMITGWATWLSESWHLVRTSFVDSMGRAGVPRTVVYDGGGSFHNIWTDPHGFATRKRETAAVKKARELISKGYPGFYEQFGVEKRVKTIPGNSESKQIEAAWGDIFGEWERQQVTFVGKDFMNRPEWMRMTNLALMKKHAGQIMTWDEYVSSMGEFINEWNNRPRPSLTRLDGSMASPIEAYNEFSDSIRKPVKEVVEHVCWHPRKAVVQRDGVYLDGLLYRHPAFGCYLGQSMLVEYDERNRWECTIATMSGEKLATPARLVIPGMHMDDEQSQRAMIDRARYEKELKAVYLARANQGDAITMQEMNSITARVDMLLQDQSRRQEIEKASVIDLPLQKSRVGKQISGTGRAVTDLAGGFDSVEDEFADCAAVEVEREPVDDDDDMLINEITKDLSNIGLRSTR